MVEMGGWVMKGPLTRLSRVKQSMGCRPRFSLPDPQSEHGSRQEKLLVIPSWSLQVYLRYSMCHTHHMNSLFP